MSREEYLAKLQTHLDDWKVDLEKLEAKAAEATGEVRAKLDEQLAELAVKWEEGRQRLDELAESADEKWEELKVETEAKWDQLTEVMKESVERIKAHFG